MQILRLLPLAALVAAVAFAAITAGASSEEDRRTESDQPIPNRFIITMQDGVQPDGYAIVYGLRRDAIVLHRYHDAVQGFAGAFSPDVIAALERDPLIKSIEQDTVVTTLDQIIPTGIRRAGADENATAAIDGVDNPLDIDIAVIDTGVDIDHPDLRVAGGFASYAWIFGSYAACGFYTSSFDDGHGHGTHVAGTIAAKDNTIGVVGMAPGARIWAVRVLSPSGSGCMSDVIAGVDWVTANAATIEAANMSLGGGSSSSLCDAIANSVAAGVFYAVAAGNSARDANNYSPANCASATTVSAVADSDGEPGGLGSAMSYGPDDTLASFSNYGSAVDIAAPGVSILSTYRGGGLATMSGTSMASPHVAGAAALHILNTSAPVDATGVAAVEAALVAAAAPQSSLWGFSGDSDGFAEPMLCVGVACASGGPPPTATNTATPVPPTNTPTNTATPVPPTNTPTNTPTPVPPTNTPTNTPTPIPPTNTPTNTPTPIPPTNTPTNTATPVPPTNTPTNTPTPIPPTNTPTNTATPIPPTNTSTNTPTPIPPTNTSTNTPTPIPPTNTPTNTPTPIPPTNTPANTPTPVPPTNTPTNTPTPVPSGALLYLTVRGSTLGGFSATQDDIVSFDGSGFSMLFDGSDVGLSGHNIDAFAVVDSDTILMSFDDSAAIPGIGGTVDDSDIVEFTATSLGASTSGTFAIFFDGSDVGLTRSAEDIDALDLLPNGDLVISTRGSFGVPGLSGRDEDIARFTPSSTGALTAGTWNAHLDNSDVGLSSSSEDIDALAMDASSNVYESTLGNFRANGLSGADDDVFSFTPTTTGSSTSGTFNSPVFFDGGAHGLSSDDVVGLDLP